MQHLTLTMILLSLLLQFGCGKSDSTDATGDRISAPPIRGSAFQAMIFTGEAVDPSVPTARVYQYALDDGVISSLSFEASKNAALFYDGAKVLLFNRLEGQESFAIISPAQESSASKSIPLAIKAGDPFDIAPLTPGRTSLLAEPLGGKLRVLDHLQGTLQEFDLVNNITSRLLRPIGLFRHGERISIIHTGLEIQRDGSAVSDRSQQIFRLQVGPDDSLSFIDANRSTIEIDGIPLTGSNPPGFLNKKGSSAKILSLCNKDITPCVSALERYDGERITETTSWNQSFGYEFLGQIIDGPNDDQVFAHVLSKDGKPLIVKIDLTSKSVEEIHTFPDQRLYGMAYDTTSQTLFVGGTKDGFGLLTMYQGAQKLEPVFIEGVLYRSVFVKI